jgi:hypothetical protein
MIQCAGRRRVAEMVVAASAMIAKATFSFAIKISREESGIASGRLKATHVLSAGKA